MPDYRVVWEIDITADSPRAAAERARAYQQMNREGAWVGVFEVIDENGATVRVDLDEPEESEQCPHIE